MKRIIKHVLLLVFTFMLVLGGVSANAAEPTWMGKLTVPDGYLIGFGSSITSANDAKAKALSRIAEQISVTVSSATRISINENKSHVSSHRSRDIRLSSNKKLSGATLIKKAYLNGRYFQAWQVDMRPVVNVLAEKLQKKYRGYTGRIIWNTYPQIRHSRLFKQLSTLLASSLESNTAETIRLNVTLDRKHNSWRLTVDNIVLTLDDRDVLDAVKWLPLDEGFHLAAVMANGQQSKRLTAGDLFSLELTTDLFDEKPAGYYSVYNVYSDGRVTLLQDNLPLQKHQRLSDRHGPFVLEAQPLVPNQLDYDTYIALGSKNKVNNDRFRQQKSDVVTDPSSYKLHELLQQVNEKDMNKLSSLTIEIAP